MSNLETIKSKLQRLYELAQRGDKHEAETAQRLLEEQLSKHGLIIADILNARLTTYEFRYKTEMEQRLICQIAYALGVQTFEYTNSRKKVLVVECTAAQYAEIAQRIDFYWELLKQEIDLFYTAFLHKHKLFKPNDGTEEDTGTTLTPEQIRQLAAMVRSMQDKTFLTAIDQPKP